MSMPLEIVADLYCLQRDPSKAGLYIQQLDEARCHGNWATVPELVRKIKKHAPNRTCMCHFEFPVSQTAETCWRDPKAIIDTMEQVSH